MPELSPNEIQIEILKYEAKEARIRAYMDSLEATEPQNFPEGAPCPGCTHGWREFQNHRKDLEQLTKEQAKSALGANTNYLNRLRQR